MSTTTAPSTASAATSQASTGGRSSTEQIAALAAPLDHAKVRKREQGSTRPSSCAASTRPNG